MTSTEHTCQRAGPPWDSTSRADVFTFVNGPQRALLLLTNQLEMEASDSPTINLVILCYYKLHSLLKRIPGDEQPMVSMAFKKGLYK